MDPLSIFGVTSNVISVIDLAGKLIKYGKDVRDAPAEISALRVKLESLIPVFTRLRDYCSEIDAEAKGPAPPGLQSLYEARRVGKDAHGHDRYEYTGHIVRLKELLSKVVKMLFPTNKVKKTRIYSRVMWTLHKDDFEKVFAEIDTCMVSINLIFTVDVHAAQTEDRAVLHKLAKDGDRREARQLRLEEEVEREKICKWLSPLSFYEKRDELWESSYHNVGNWLWRDDCFTAWKQKVRPWYLELAGGIGTGKTVLSSVIAHHLDDEFGPKSIPVLSIFLDYKSSSTQTLPHLMGSILKQLVQRQGSLENFKDLKEEHERARQLDLKVKSRIERVEELLEEELDRYERYFLLVDGIDELTINESNTLLRRLRKLTNGRGSLMITKRSSRKNDSRMILYDCDRCFRKQNRLTFRCMVCAQGDFDVCYVCMSEGKWCLDETRAHELKEPYSSRVIEIMPTDIEGFVRWRIDLEISGAGQFYSDDRDIVDQENLPTTGFQGLLIGSADQDDAALQARIVAEVTSKADGRFLFARLYMDSLQFVSTMWELNKTIDKFPSDLIGVYRAAMERIKKQDLLNSQRAFRILAILNLARRSLKVDELRHALAVCDFGVEGNNTSEDIQDSLTEQKIILACTLSLVTVEGGYFRLVHRTLEDFFQNESNAKEWIPGARREMAHACTIYLDLVLPRNSSDNAQLVDLSKKFTLLGYAAQYWGEHVHAASEVSEPAAEVRRMALKLLCDSQLKDACMRAAWATDEGGHGTWDVWRGVDKLHICAWFGLTSLLLQLRPEEGMVDRIEPKYGQTPLMYACRKGHADTARELLKLGASQSRVSSRGRNSLFEAILAPDATSSGDESSTDISKHTQVVRLLVCKKPEGLDINYRHDQSLSQTALMLVARLGYLGMAKTLLSHPGIKVDLQDFHGRTALYLATIENDIKMVKVLLEAEADTSITDTQAGGFALRVAAQRGYCDLIELLLKNGADMTMADHEGATAMLRAVNRGEIDAVRTLMDHSVDLSVVDNNGQTLLHGAAVNAYVDIARLLLEGRPPKLKSLHPDVRDKYGMTPLHWASRHDHAPMLQLLLRYGADVTLEDEFKRTSHLVAWQYGSLNALDQLGSSPTNFDAHQRPIWSMARLGLHDVIEQSLSSRPDDFLVREPCTDNSALHCAVETFQTVCLDKLLESSHLDINAGNSVHRTPLHIAALVDNLPATEALIDNNANLEALDKWQNEALFLAELNGNRFLMLLLIDGGAKLNKLKIDWKALFFFAVEVGNDRVVKVLLDRHGIDRSVQNKDGLRALQIATAKGDEDMMRVLRAAETMSFAGGSGGGGISGETTLNEEGEDEGGDLGRMKFVPFRSRPLDLGDDVDSDDDDDSKDV